MESATQAPRAGQNAPPVAVDDTGQLLVDDGARASIRRQNDTDADDDSSR